jgi:Arc/MetJ family transcription regulator
LAAAAIWMYLIHMRTTMVIDDDLLREAKRYSSAKTMSDLVNEALRFFIQMHEQRTRDEKKQFAPKLPTRDD